MKKLIAVSLFFAFSVATYAQQEGPAAKKAVKKETAKGDHEAAKVNNNVKKEEHMAKKEANATTKMTSEKMDMGKTDMKKMK